MRNLCDTSAKAEHCLINRLRLKFRDDLRITDAEASLNGLNITARLAVDQCDQYQEREECQESREREEAEKEDGGGLGGPPIESGRPDEAEGSGTR